MWHKEKNTNPIVRLALLLALASTPMMTNLFKSDYVLAQSPAETPSFPLPTAVPNGTKIRVDGSASMTRANEALKGRFEKEYSGADVEIATNGTDEALKALEEGKIDIAAIGRGLTPEQLEKSGFEQQRLRREKIAIIVGKDNPFKRDLDNRLFTKIYTGEITNWSEVGGPDKEIRVIDRPDFSDTREAFKNYPLFRGRFKTGSTATQLDSDDPAEVVKQLGDDGIGFVLANQVENLGDEVRILSMHRTLPDDPRYPYSQPLVYVYKENPSEAVKNFVGFATAEPGKEALQAARTAEAVAVAAAVSQAVSGDATDATATPGATTDATPGATPGVTPGATADGTAADSENETANNTNGTAADSENETANNTNGAVTEDVGTATNTSASDSDSTALLPDNTDVSAEAGKTTMPWWWILLPAAVIGALALWWLLGRRKSQEDDTVARGVLPENSPPPFNPTSVNTSPVKEPELVENTPVEPNAGINTAAEAPNTAGGINAAGIAAGAAGIAAGAAALSSRNNNEDTPEIRDNFVAETSPEAGLDIPDSQQPEVSGTGLDIEAPDYLEADIPDTSLDLEAPADVVSSSFPSLPRINTPLDDVEAPPTTEPVVADTPSENNQESNTVPQEELPSASTNNFLGNFAFGAGVAGAAAAAGAGAQRIKSQFAGKQTPESTEDESSQTSGTVSYPQLPDVWDSTQAEEVSTEPENSSVNSDSGLLNQENSNTDNDVISPSSLWGTPQTEEVSTQEEQQESSFALGNTPDSDSSLLNRDDENTPEENNDVISPSSLWGTPQAEEPPTQEEEEEKSSFSLGGAAAGAGLVAGAAALGSKLFNRDNNDTSEDSNKTEENQDVEQQATTEEQKDKSVSTGLGSGWFLNRFRQNTPDATADTDVADNPPTSEIAETSELPEVRITKQDEQSADAQATLPQEQPANDGLPNVWVTQSNQQPATPEETVTQEEIAQFGVSATSESEDTSTSATNAVLAGGAAVGAFALGSQMKTNDEQPQEQNSETSTPQESFSGDVALDEVADQAEIDTMIRTSKPDSDQGDTDWDRIYGIHHNGATAVPGESNILLANRTPKWAYASWNIAAADREAMQERGAAQLVLRLYDTTNIDLSYQNAKLVQQYECEETVNHRYVAIPNANRDYIAEIGYLTQDKEWLLVSRSPIVRVFSRPHKDFWFEADAELIIHGATEPGSTVTIDGHNIKVKQDGTFHLRVPFTESMINYLITAVAPDSEQAKTIHMQFSQKERNDS